MQFIKGPVYSHHFFDDNNKIGKVLAKYRNFEDKQSSNIAKIIGADDGFEVKNYRDLVEKIAEIAYENNRQVLVYRGQGRDYRVSGSSKRSSLYPTIFRDTWGEYKITKSNRPLYFRRLDKLVKSMRPKVFKEPDEGSSDSGIDTTIHTTRKRRYDEQMLAIIQHYELFPTPMIDVTQSLQVACSFALSDLRNDSAFIYVFGLPAIGGSVSYSVEDETCVARLQTVCPPKAIRAHFQEGLLISKFPLSQRKTDNSNLANRLLAKFKVSRKDFWSDGYSSLNLTTLLPESDPFADELRAIQVKEFPDLLDGLEKC